MKAVVLCVLVLCAFAATVRACRSCPPHRNPQCGFNGACIYEFDNPCELLLYNCQMGAHFRQTSMHQCSSARNGNNAYRICHESGNHLW